MKLLSLILGASLVCSICTGKTQCKDDKPILLITQVQYSSTYYRMSSRSSSMAHFKDSASCATAAEHFYASATEEDGIKDRINYFHYRCVDVANNKVIFKETKEIDL